MSRAKRARRTLRAAALACLILGVALPATLSSSPAGAVSGTTQNNGCLGVTGTFSQFAVPITGTASPKPATTNDTITLSGTSVSISVDATLIGAGVATGLVSAADKLADLGVKLNDGTADQSAGINQVVAAPGKVTLKISATNTVEGTKTASNAATASTTFYVTADSTGGSVKVYTSVTNPPVLGGPNVADPSRTGTLLVGSLSVPIALGDTTWTPSGAGTVTFAELNIAPANLTSPSAADQLAAPLIILPKINNKINVPFHCWPGTVPSTALVPGPSAAIDSVTVTQGGPTTTAEGGNTTTSTSTTTTTEAPTTTTAPPAPTTTAPPAPTTTVPGVTYKTRSQAYVTNCTNSLDPKSTSNLNFVITATAPEKFPAGQNFALTNQTWTVTTPGSLIDLGLNTGLLNPGDIIPAQVTAAINATNTAQKTVTSAPVKVSVGPIVVDQVTGKAKNLTTTFKVPDMTFVSGGGVVQFSMGTTTFQLTIGTLKVVFTCTPQQATVLLSTTIEGKATVTTLAVPTTTVPGSSIGGTSTSGTLPFTGAGHVWLLLAIALAALDLGAVALSAARSAQKRLGLMRD